MSPLAAGSCGDERQSLTYPGVEVMVRYLLALGGSFGGCRAIPTAMRRWVDPEVSKWGLIIAALGTLPTWCVTWGKWGQDSAPS